MMVLLGCDNGGGSDSGTSRLEELLERQRLGTTRTHSAGTKATHELVAVLAVLLAEELGPALSALVHGAILAGLGLGQLRCGQRLLMAEPEGLLPTGVLAGAAGSSRWEIAAAHDTACRYGTVTRRHLPAPRTSGHAGGRP